MDAEIGDEACHPALRHRAGDDVEHGGAGNQQQHQGGADEQADVRGAGNDDLHGRTFLQNAMPSESLDRSGLSMAASAR